VVAGEPWPLSDDYGTEPESSWGPPEVLAHVAEMLPYWLGQIETIVAAPEGEVPSFGRVATDANRLARIGEDRELPVGELLDRVAGAASTAGRRLAELTPAEAGRHGVHERLGEMSVPAIVERFVVGHLEDHVRQLDEVVGGG
jgi:hypothetical protein